LDTFWKDTCHTHDPIQRAERLEQDPQIASFHDQATSSQDNQTSRGTSVDDDIITHFITFISSHHQDASQSILYELDGRKVQPIMHGLTTTLPKNDTLLQDACTIIREQFMARDPNELRFTILALAPNTTTMDD
jgi:hypothetical protein